MEDNMGIDEIEKLEQDIKELEGKDSSYGSPSPAQKESLFRFFRTILSAKDTTRIANISKEEIGISDLSVRGWKRIAHYAKLEGLDKVAEYLDGQAEIINSTSMSKEGFWSQLFVTQIKREQKEKPKEQKKKGWLSSKSEESA